MLDVKSLIPLEDTVDPRDPLTIPAVKLAGRRGEVGKAWKIFYLPKGENVLPAARHLEKGRLKKVLHPRCWEGLSLEVGRFSLELLITGSHHINYPATGGNVLE